MVKIKCNLGKVRKEKKLKQTDLALMTGISQKAISELESGKSKGISFSTLSKLCKVLNVTPNELFEVEKDEESLEIEVLEKTSCSFCGKKEHEVDVLIVSKNKKILICSNCVAHCNDLINKRR